MSNESIFCTIFNSIKAKINSFISNVKYSDNVDNYFENLNSSLKQKKKKKYPSNFKSQKKYSLSDLNNNKSRELTKFKYAKINENDNEESKYKFIKINENNDILIGEKLSQNFLGKKTDRININNNSIDLNNELINDFNLTNELSSEESLEKISNNIILNKPNNNNKMNINQNTENEVKIENYIDIDEKENMKIYNKESIIKNKKIIKINNEEDEKEDDNNNKNDIIDLNEKEININDSNFSIKNNSINNSLNYSRVFNGRFDLVHDSFSYNCKNLKKNFEKNNFVFKKENEFSYEMKSIKDKESIKDLNNENNTNKIIINKNKENNTFLLPNNYNEKENNKINIDKFSKKSNLFGNKTNENENKNDKEIKTLFDTKNTKNIFFEPKS